MNSPLMFWLNTSCALLTIAPWRLLVSPASVPFVISVPPEYVFAPVRVSVPAPAFTSDPTPLITPP